MTWKMKWKSDTKHFLFGLVSFLVFDSSRSQSTSNSDQFVPALTELGPSPQNLPILRTETMFPASTQAYVSAATTYIPIPVSVSQETPSFQNPPTSTYLPPVPSSTPFYIPLSEPRDVNTPAFIPPSSFMPPFIPQSPDTRTSLPLSSQASPLSTDTPLHFQWTFWNLFSQLEKDKIDFPTSAKKAQPQIAKLFDVTSERISDIVFQADPDGYVTVRFNVQPGSTILTSTTVALKSFLSILIFQGDGIRIQLDLPNDSNLSPLKAYYNWTDGGLCPQQPCSKNSSCLSSLTGTFYCDRVAATSSQMTNSNNNNNNNLLALIIIPLFVVVAVAILLVIYVWRYRTPKEKSRIEVTNLGYNDGMSRISGMTMADIGVRNLVYTTMGKSFAMHFNDDTFSPKKDDSDDFIYTPE